MFDVGQQVRCIDERWGQTITGGVFQRTACPNLPTPGCIYTIRQVDCHPGEEYVRLVEIANPVNRNTGIEPVFRAAQFVPLGRATDISFAHDLLANPTRLKRPSKDEVSYFRRRKSRERVSN